MEARTAANRGGGGLGAGAGIVPYRALDGLYKQSHQDVPIRSVYTVQCVHHTLKNKILN